MENENEQKSDVEPEELVEPEEILDEAGNDTTDWKTLAHKNFGIAKRYKTKLDKRKKADEKVAKEAKEKVEKEEKEKKGKEAKAEESGKEPQDKKEFDLAEKAYLKASGVKKEEFPLFLEEIKASKKSIDELLESKYFQEKREKNASKLALPKDNKRGGGSAKDDVDYWIKKGEYPPNTPENVELRRKVAAALSKQSKDKNKFSEYPIV